MKTEEIPFQQLIDALLDESQPFPPRYLYRLSDLEPNELKPLASVWEDVEVRRRQALLEDLEELNERDTLLSYEALARLALFDVDPQVRKVAVRMLWEYEDTDLVPKFVRLLNDDPEVSVRAEAAGALGRYIYLGEVEEIDTGTQRIVEEALLQTMQGKDLPPVRRRALESLGFSSRKDVLPLIEQAYASGDKEWVASALFAMGRSAHERWAGKVISMFDHSYTGVRLEAARAAGELELGAAVEPLLELLDDDDDDVRMAAIWSLSQIGGEGVRDVIEGLFEEAENDEDADFMENALNNLVFTEEGQLFELIDLADIDEEDTDEEDTDEDEDQFSLIEENLDDEDVED